MQHWYYLWHIDGKGREFITSLLVSHHLHLISSSCQLGNYVVFIRLRFGFYHSRPFHRKSELFESLQRASIIYLDP